MRAPALSTVWGPSEVEALSAPMAAAGGKVTRNRDGSWTLRSAGKVCLRFSLFSFVLFLTSCPAFPTGFSIGNARSRRG